MKHFICCYGFELKLCPLLNSLISPPDYSSSLPPGTGLTGDIEKLGATGNSGLTSTESRATFSESSLWKFSLMCFFLACHVNSGILYPKQLREPSSCLPDLLSPPACPPLDCTTTQSTMLITTPLIKNLTQQRLCPCLAGIHTHERSYPRERVEKSM